MTARLRPPENLVSPRAVPMWTIRAMMGAVLNILVVIGITWFLDVNRFTWIPDRLANNIWWVPAGYAVYALLKAIVVPQWRYRVHRWEVSAEVVYTRSGWINRQWQLVPVSRIQTVDHTQDWMERLFGLATLVVQTASHAGSSTISGLEAGVARHISEDLAAVAGELRDDAT